MKTKQRILPLRALLALTALLTLMLCMTAQANAADVMEEWEQYGAKETGLTMFYEIEPSLPDYIIDPYVYGLKDSSMA